VRGAVGATVPKRRRMPVSQPTQYSPVRSSEVETSCPRPLRSRWYSAAMIPETSAIAVT